MRVGFTEWSTRASTKERPFIDMFHVMAPTSSTDDGATHFSIVFRRNSGWQHSEETQVDTASLPPLYMHCCRCICTLLLSLLLPPLYTHCRCRCHCDSPLLVRLRMHCCNIPTATMKVVERENRRFEYRHHTAKPSDEGGTRKVAIKRRNLKAQESWTRSKLW